MCSHTEPRGFAFELSPPKAAFLNRYLYRKQGTVPFEGWCLGQHSGFGRRTVENRELCGVWAGSRGCLCVIRDPPGANEQLRNSSGVVMVLQIHQKSPLKYSERQMGSVPCSRDWSMAAAASLKMKKVVFLYQMKGVSELIVPWWEFCLQCELD